MDRKKLVLLLGALIIAIGTALAARSMFAGAAAPQSQAAAPQPVGPKVLVAKRGLPVGTIITADSIGFQQWPSELVQDAYFLDGEADMSKLLGFLMLRPPPRATRDRTRFPFTPGDRGFLAAALGPGMRAVTVPVSAKTGVGGFVFPGDRVDLVLTQSISGDEGAELKTSETIIRNLRVLATDQSTEQETEEGKTVVKEFRTVTLEVTPRIAEKVSVAQTIGTLSLSLRSIADNQSELEQAIAAGEVTIPDNATPEEEARILREAMSRPIDRGTTFVTGGDVSRFQRSTVPPRRSSAQREAQAQQAIGSMTTAIAGLAGATGGGAAAGAAAAAPSGPVVRVTRGKETTAVEVGRN